MRDVSQEETASQACVTSPKGKWTCWMQVCLCCSDLKLIVLLRSMELCNPFAALRLYTGLFHPHLKEESCSEPEHGKHKIDHHRHAAN